MKNLIKSSLVALIVLVSGISFAGDRETVPIGENNSYRVFFKCGSYGDACFMNNPEKGTRLATVTWYGIGAKAGSNLYMAVSINCKNGTYDENNSGTFEKPKQGTLLADMVKVGCRL